jgi:hypothetical protein
LHRAYSSIGQDNNSVVRKRSERRIGTKEKKIKKKIAIERKSERR